MTNDIDLIRMNNTVIEILRKFPSIQNKKNFYYSGIGKSFFYGLKSSNFNKFSEFKNGDRIFNHWRDKLVQIGFLFKIYPKKQRSSPYAITPLGIAYLVKNSHLDKYEIHNCINVVIHFFKEDKKGLKFDKMTPALHVTFENACKLMEFHQDKVIFQTSFLNNITLIIHIELNKSTKDSAYYLIGNMCWLCNFMYIYNMIEMLRVNNNTEYSNLKKSYAVLPNEVKVFGQLFGDKIVLPILEYHTNYTKEVLKFPIKKIK